MCVVFVVLPYFITILIGSIKKVGIVIDYVNRILMADLCDKCYSLGTAGAKLGKNSNINAG